MFDLDDLQHAAKAMQVGLWTMVGGILGHVVDVVLNGKEWSLKGHIAIAITAFLVGQVLGDLMPNWVVGKYGLMMMLGTISAPLYKKIQAWLSARVMKGLG